MHKVCVYEAIILSQWKCSCLNVKRRKSRIKILSNLRKTLIHVSKKATRISVAAVFIKAKNQVQPHQQGMGETVVDPYTGSPIQPR